MSDKPIKCAANGFSKSLFYLIQKNGEDKRFVVSFDNKQEIKTFLEAFIDSASGNLQIKINDLEIPDHPLVFGGLVTKLQIKEVLETYEDFIFHDGFHALMMRIPENNDYIAFDEHGLLFIYTEKDYSDTLKKFGLAYKTDEKLIYEFDHWHYRPKNGRDDLKKIIDKLGF